jgi:hypothetical protein
MTGDLASQESSRGRAALVFGAVQVDLHLAARLAPSLRRGVEAEVRDGRLVRDEDLRRGLAMFDVAEQLAEQRKVAAPVARPVALLDSPGCDPSASGALRGLLHAAQVARRVGVSEQAVRKAASDGRLVGRRGPRGWEFTDQAVRAWETTRRRRSMARVEDVPNYRGEAPPGYGQGRDTSKDTPSAEQVAAEQKLRPRDRQDLPPADARP